MSGAPAMSEKERVARQRRAAWNAGLAKPPEALSGNVLVSTAMPVRVVHPRTCGAVISSWLHGTDWVYLLPEEPVVRDGRVWLDEYGEVEVCGLCLRLLREERP